MKIPFVKYYLVASILLALLGAVLTNSYSVGLCERDINLNIQNVGCHLLFERIGDPLLYGGAALAIVFLILFAYPKGKPAWKKFAVWFIPLATLLFIFYPNPGSGDFLSPMPEQIFQWVSAFYIFVSVAVVSFSSK